MLSVNISVNPGNAQHLRRVGRLHGSSKDAETVRSWQK